MHAKDNMKTIYRKPPGTQTDCVRMTLQ